MGMKYFLALSSAASHGFIPDFRLYMYPSIITMELSTVIPSTTTSAAKVTVLRGMPNMYISPMLIKVLSGITMAATRAVRIGKSTIITRITTSMAMNRSRRNETTDSPTTSDWSIMVDIVTSSGRLVLR